jgi:imidazolonepropionase-like amidohydrolase
MPLIASAGALSAKLIQLDKTSGRTLVTGGVLIDGRGGPPLTNALIVIDGERITRVGCANDPVEPCPDAQVIDASGQWIMPGLTDSHIHLTGEVTFDVYRRYLAPSEDQRLLRAAGDVLTMLETGFTTLREPGGKFGTILKHAVNSGVITGPRILAAGVPLTTTGGHGDWRPLPYEWVKDGQWRGLIVDGAEDCRKAVRTQFRNGADLIKVLASAGGVTNTDEDLGSSGVAEFTNEELAAIVDETHRHRARVAAHNTGPDVVRQSLELGVDTIEHGVLGPNDYDLLDLMAEKGVPLVPTLCIFYRTAYQGDALGVFKNGQDAARRILDQQLKTVFEAKRRGVTVALGTDCVGAIGVGESALELRLLAEAGLSNLDALACGTRNGAITMGLDKQLGTLEAGKLADIIIVNKDPVADITVLEERSSLTRIIRSQAPLSRSP